MVESVAKFVVWAVIVGVGLLLINVSLGYLGYFGKTVHLSRIGLKVVEARKSTAVNEIEFTAAGETFHRAELPFGFVENNRFGIDPTKPFTISSAPHTFAPVSGTPLYYFL